MTCGQRLQAVIIPEGGHHLDLFFSNEEDPDSVTEARTVEADCIEQWIDEYHKD
jgi:lysosomal Pro-X carboxypeptidase